METGELKKIGKSAFDDGAGYAPEDSTTIVANVDDDAQSVTYDVVISQDSNNALEEKSDGLYAKQVSTTVDPLENLYVIEDNGISTVAPTDDFTYELELNEEIDFIYIPYETGSISANNSYEFHAYLTNLSFVGEYEFDISWTVNTGDEEILIASAARIFENIYVSSDVLYTPLVTALTEDVVYDENATFTLKFNMVSGSDGVNLVSESTNPITLIRNGQFTISTNIVYGVDENGNPATQKAINDEIRSNISATQQSVINVSASISTISGDITTINGEIDGIDELLDDLSDEVGEQGETLTTLSGAVGTINTNMNNQCKSVTIDGATTFLAVDNTEYYWNNEVASIVVTLPTPTDLTYTHEIVLVFKSGDTATTLNLPEDVENGDYEITANTRHEISLKYYIDTWVLLAR